MSTTTSNLGLFKYDTTTDGQVPFNINVALNNNWDILDNSWTSKENVVKHINNLGSRSGSMTLSSNSIYRLTPSGACKFKLPSISSSLEFHQILIQINMTSVQTINVGTTYFFNQTAPDLSESGVYNLIYEYDSNNAYWVCGLLSKGVAS